MLQFVPKEYVNLLLSVFFIALGVSALARASRLVSSTPSVPLSATRH